MGVTDVASSVFADRFGCWAWLDLWRCGATFSTDEVALLRALTGPLTEALRAAQARTFVEDAEPVDLAGPAVLLLDAGLRVVSQTATADVALRELNPPGEEPLPTRSPQRRSTSRRRCSRPRPAYRSGRPGRACTWAPAAG